VLSVTEIKGWDLIDLMNPVASESQSSLERTVRVDLESELFEGPLTAHLYPRTSLGNARSSSQMTHLS